MYKIELHRQAQKRLKTMPSADKVRIAEKLYFLSADPDDQRLDIKRLQNKSAFRMRVGDWRIIFERDDNLKVIAVEKIGARGNIYK